MRTLARRHALVEFGPRRSAVVQRSNQGFRIKGGGSGSRRQG